MSEKDKQIIMDGYKQILSYATPSRAIPSRISVNELLGDGGLHFHNSGNSNINTVKFTSIINQEDKAQIEHWLSVQKQGSLITLISSFNSIPSGEYYSTSDIEFTYLDAVYYSIDWELTLKGEDDSTSNVLTDSISTNEALTFDLFNDELKEGSSDINQVKQLQTLLQINGYYLFDGTTKLHADGVWDNKLTSALQQYQMNKGLKVTGTLTEETKQSLLW